jgi:predicted nucleotidyltransferase
MQAVKITTEQPELAERFDRVLTDTVEAMNASGVRYAFIGGIASHGLGRPRSTHDIDVFVRPEDAEIALRALEKHGFRIERTDPSWLYKGWKENILVDIIFKSKGEIYLDNEMWEHAAQREYHGRELKMIGPEDLTIVKASAHSELTPGHWHDALALLSHATIDWNYLIKRARRAPRRVLSLLIYAHSNDIWVPKQVIDELYRYVYGEIPLGAPARTAHSQQTLQRPVAALKAVHKVDATTVARMHEALAEDPRTNELDIQVEAAEGKVLLRGEVMTEERRQRIERIAREIVPQVEIENQIRVTQISQQAEAEEIK